MSLTRADLVADICIFSGALVMAAGALVRAPREGYQEAVRRQIRRSLLGGAVLVLSMSDGTQVLIDQLSGVPNLGALVRLALVPAISYRTLALQDTLIDAGALRRRWHAGFAVVAVAATIVCWQAGFPHDRALPTIPVAVPLGGANGWLYALAWLFCAELIVQFGEATRTAFRILLHVYATGYERATCLSTLLFGLAQGCFCAVGVGLLLYPPGQATGHFRWIDFSTLTTECLGLTGALFALAAYGAPVWVRQRQMHQGDRLDRLLRSLLLLSTYGAVRQLALHLQAVLPAPRRIVRREDTGLWRVRRIDDLGLLLQLFKTVINDARLVLLPYAGPAGSGSTDPVRSARALATALANHRAGRQPPEAPDPKHPLRAGRLFNDERFLAALWHSYRRLGGDHGKR